MEFSKLIILIPVNSSDKENLSNFMYSKLNATKRLLCYSVGVIVSCLQGSRQDFKSSGEKKGLFFWLYALFVAFYFIFEKSSFFATSPKMYWRNLASRVSANVSPACRYNTSVEQRNTTTLLKCLTRFPLTPLDTTKLGLCPFICYVCT